MIENLDEMRLNSLETDMKSLQERAETAEEGQLYFREAYDQAVRSMLAQEDVGWNLISGINSDENNFSNNQLQDISKQIRQWTDTNPLLSRGCEIRASYLFGSGYAIGTEDAETNISARAQALIDDVINQNAVFSADALIAANKAVFTSGQHFVIFNKLTEKFAPLPFHRVKDAIYNPDDSGEVWYYLVNYSARVQDFTTGDTKTVEVKEWYPVDTYKPKGGFAKVIDKSPVVVNKFIVDFRVNRPAGSTWGIPDAFAASPWALAYSAYLRDGTKVLASLAEWAWKLSPKSKTGFDKASAGVRKQGAGAGGVAVTEMELQALPRANAVDLNTGRPLASQVAASLGISVVILLSDPGQSGAYGTAQTLTDPSIRTMRLRQDAITDFIKRCLRLLGVKKPSILWEKMSPDVDYREMQTVVSALGTGLFHEDETRPVIAKLAGITILHSDPPEGYMVPNNADSGNRADIDADGNPKQPDTNGGTPLTNGQGKSNSAAGKLTDGDNSARAAGDYKPKNVK
jgi:hypothetical protein